MGAAEKIDYAERLRYRHGCFQTDRRLGYDHRQDEYTADCLCRRSREMGHYVLHHIPKQLSIFEVGLFVAVLSRLSHHSAASARAARRPLGNWWCMDDWASLPALLLVLIGVFLIVLSPISNTVQLGISSIRRTPVRRLGGNARPERQTQDKWRRRRSKSSAR